MSLLEAFYRKYVEPVVSAKPRLFYGGVAIFGVCLAILLVFRARIVELSILEQMQKLEKTSKRVSRFLGKKAALEERFNNLALDAQGSDFNQVLEKIFSECSIEQKPEYKTGIKSENLKFSKNLTIQTVFLNLEQIDLKRSMDLLNKVAMTPGLSTTDFELSVEKDKINMKIGLVFRKAAPKALTVAS